MTLVWVGAIENVKQDNNNFLGQLGALRVPERKDGMWTVALSNGTSIELPKIGT